MNPDESLAQAYAKELPWLAFLYVSEELSPDEVVDFEERLLTDQTVREAVADAMKLSDGVWLASALDSYTPTPKPEAAPAALAIEANRTARGAIFSRLSLWMVSTAAAAALAFCVGWWFAGQGGTGDSNPVAEQPDLKPSPEAKTDHSPTEEGAERLVGLWSESQDLLAQLGPASESPSELFEEFHSQEGSDSEEEAFAWMLSAVSPEPQNNTPEVMEN